MRVETVNGRKLVCGHIFKVNEIKAGQRWAPADGSDHEVKIVSVDRDRVKYEWDEQGQRKTHEKSSFAFQCRYCKVL